MNFNNLEGKRVKFEGNTYEVHSYFEKNNQLNLVSNDEGIDFIVIMLDACEDGEITLV